jgi:hypothetical protein
MSQGGTESDGLFDAALRRNLETPEQLEAYAAHLRLCQGKHSLAPLTESEEKSLQRVHDAMGSDKMRDVLMETIETRRERQDRAVAEEHLRVARQHSGVAREIAQAEYDHRESLRYQAEAAAAERERQRIERERIAEIASKPYDWDG